MSGSLHDPLPSASADALSGTAGLLSLLGGKLTRVEGILRENLRSELEPVDRAGRYVGAAGGKRLRPMLVLLSSGLLRYEGDHDVLMAAVFEFIHTATLVHDDIIDEAETRRGRPSANRVFGNEATVLLGDYLYIRSMNMALEAGQLRLIEVLAEATERMIEGEILGANLRGRVDVTREQHLEIVERKTAWLFSACCRVGAVLTGAPAASEEKLARYGMSLGIAFQLVDDLLDLTADAATLGKPVASDLREGRMTLPWIDLYERGSARERGAIERVVTSGAPGIEPNARAVEADLELLEAALRRSDGLADTRRLAQEHAARAVAIAASFPTSPYRDWFERLPRMLLDRER